MFVASTLDDQYTAAATDDLRILVVGSGIAGLTAAQLLRHKGSHPVLIERAADSARLLDENLAGYMLALMPMVDPVFDELDLWDSYLERGVPLARYGLHNHQGRLVRRDSMASLLAAYGTYQGIARGELIDVLTGDDCPVTFGTTVGALHQRDAHTTATLLVDDGRVDLDFDLIVIADGIHSPTRRLVTAGQRVDVLDTEWGGWVVWAPTDEDTDLGEELWGRGFFVGAYPVKGRLGVFLGGPNADTSVGARRFVARIRADLTEINPRLERALRAVEESENPYYWPLADCRARTWASTRSILLGDAAAGFLPTAGIGAGMAMESAWVLASMINDATPETLATQLESYEHAQRPRVEAAQETSRQLARWMFHTSPVVATVRDLAMRLISVQVALKPIQKLLKERPDPRRQLV